MKLFRKIAKPAVLLGMLLLTGFVVGCGSKKEESYRSIKVYAVDGKGWVSREGVGEMELYANMQLQNHDELRTDSESYVQLKLDEDKYVLVEPDTRIKIEAEGTAADSRTKIVLEEGAVVNRIENKLSENSSYEVESPNATMAVRGTTFRVTTWIDKNGTPVSEIEVQEGKVDCIVAVKDEENGTVSEKVVSVEEGRKTTISGMLKGIDYVEEPTTYTYDAYENEVLNFIGYSEEKEPSQEELPKQEETEDIEAEEEDTDKAKEEQEEKKQKADTQITSKEELPKEEPSDSQSSSGSSDSGNSQSSSGSSNSGNNQGSSGSGESSGDDAEGTTPTTFTVTFEVNSTVFATQTVSSGEKAVKPLLMPGTSGKWSADESSDYFSDPFSINGNTVLTWIP